MKDMQNIPFLSIKDLALLIKNREVSPVEVVKTYLQRIENIDPRTNAFISVCTDRSLMEANQAENQILSGNYLGPLHGIPVGMKDLFYTEGIQTTAGSKVKRWAEFIPTENATVVTKFKEAGAIIIGKLNLHEFASGATNQNPHYGPTHNPWALDHMTGGSSGGSGAAVAASLCAAAMGTDTGGSIRIPSAVCGIFGLMPTYGRVSRFGVVPLAWSLDHAGPMTKNVEDAALIMNIIAGYDARDPASSLVEVPDFTSRLNRGIEGLRVGIPKGFFFNSTSPQVLRNFNQAMGVLQSLGAKPTEISLPLVDMVPHIHSLIFHAEAASYHKETILNHAEEITPNVRERLQTGLTVTASQYIRAQRARALLQQEIHNVFKQIDVIATPTTSVTAPKLGQDSLTTTTDIGVESTLLLLRRNTAPFNGAGVPACNLPCGFDSLGLPTGLQLIGKPFDEVTLLRVAYAYEQATDWHTKKPAI